MHEVTRNLMSSAIHDPERRRYPRVKAKIPVELVCEGSPPMRTATDEVSLCGCYIETMFTMEPRTKLTLVFSLAEQKIQAQAVVVTRYPQVGNGIDFVVISPEDRLKMARHIATLLAENGP